MYLASWSQARLAEYNTVWWSSTTSHPSTMYASWRIEDKCTKPFANKWPNLSVPQEIGSILSGWIVRGCTMEEWKPYSRGLKVYSRVLHRLCSSKQWSSRTFGAKFVTARTRHANRNYSSWRSLGKGDSPRQLAPKSPPVNICGKPISQRLWRSNTNIYFVKITTFGQPGFAFIFRPENAEKRNFLHLPFMIASSKWKVTSAFSESTIQSRN